MTRSESTPGSQTRDGSTQGQVVDGAAVQAWIQAFAHTVALNKDLLTELDSAIGDADHGLNMDRGMTAALVALDEIAPSSPEGLFKVVGRTLVSKVGGASGPLYGTLFLRMAVAAGRAERLDATAFAAVLRAGLIGVVDRGKAKVGDKTMVDALAPACDTLDAAVADGDTLAAGLRSAAAAATAGRDATAEMVARKGRASYLGARSLGHQDPGATSAAMLIVTAAGTVGG